MLPSQIFQFCPRCGTKDPSDESVRTAFRCSACGFLYFFNPCCAVAGFILNRKGEALFLRRARDPAKGKLALPGGFIDIGETAEQALRRETTEEVGLELDALQFLCSQVNSYHYQEVTYPVLDLFFIARAIDPGQAQALDAVDSFAWCNPSAVEPEQIAFPSIRTALKIFIESGQAPSAADSSQ